MSQNGMNTVPKPPDSAISLRSLRASDGIAQKPAEGGPGSLGRTRTPKNEPQCCHVRFKANYSHTAACQGVELRKD